MDIRNDEGKALPAETPAAAATSPFEDVDEVDIDSDGDLIIRAGSELEETGRSFRVCSSALRRSSVVWKKMLFGPFKESKPASGAWIVDLPEDSPRPLEIILNMVHGNFLQVPHTPSLTELYEILQLTNKYDMISAARPWAKAWQRVLEHFKSYEKGSRSAKVAYIAWELGLAEIQTQVVEDLIPRLSVDPDGRMTTDDGVVLDDFGPIGPPDLLASMRENQKEILERLPDAINAIIQELVGQEKSYPDRTVCAQCRNNVLGSMMRAIANCRGSISLTLSAKDGETIEDFHRSVISIAQQISSQPKHSLCNPRRALEGSLEEWIRKCKFNLVHRSEARFEQMDKRRDYLGTDSVERPEEE